VLLCAISMKNDKNIKGYIALTSILVITAVVVGIIISITYLSIGELKNSLTLKKGKEVYLLAYGCVEEGLLNIRNDVNYTGTTLNIGNGSCTIAVSGTSSDKALSVIAEIGGPPRYVKKLNAEVKMTGNSVNILSIAEVE